MVAHAGDDFFREAVHVHADGTAGLWEERAPGRRVLQCATRRTRARRGLSRSSGGAHFPLTPHDRRLLNLHSLPPALAPRLGRHLRTLVATRLAHAKSQSEPPGAKIPPQGTHFAQNLSQVAPLAGKRTQMTIRMEIPAKRECAAPTVRDPNRSTGGRGIPYGYRLFHGWTRRTVRILTLPRVDAAYRPDTDPSTGGRGVPSGYRLFHGRTRRTVRAPDART
jgi:hypothetical protein